MGNSRLMIRLIDVALIILLGFIAISRLKTEYIDLPAAGKAKPTKTKTHAATIHVYGGYFDFVDRGKKRRLRDTAALESIVLASNKRFAGGRTKFVVNIEPHKSSRMQNLIDVLDICERHQIEKNFDYDRIN